MYSWELVKNPKPRLYDPESKKIVTSRDVIFAEEETWNWGRTNDEELTWDDADSFHETDKEEGDGGE